MKRRERPPVLEWTVFALALFLAGFIAYEMAKRRVKVPPPPSLTPVYTEAPAAPPPAPPRAPEMPAQRAGRAVPGSPYVKTIIVPRKRAGDIPAPVR